MFGCVCHQPHHVVTRDELILLAHHSIRTYMDQENTPHIPPLPTLPGTPCPAEIITAHQQLQNAFTASFAALQLDEADSVRLGHCCQHAKTFILPLFNAMAGQDDFPLPLCYVQLLREMVTDLVEQLETAYCRSQQRYAIVNLIQLRC